MSAYELPRDGIDGQVKQVKDTAEAIHELRGANGAESTIINGPDGITVHNPETGARMQYANGRLTFWSNFDTHPDEFGEMLVDPGAGSNILRFFPPHSAGTGLENSITVQGQRPGLGGNVWVYADNSITIRVQDDDSSLWGTMNIGASDVVIDSNRLMLYGLEPVSSSPNLVMDFPGGFPVVKLFTSSRRYKQDIVDADLDGEDVRQWEIHRWRDIAAVAEQGDDAPVHVGHIAEQIADVSPDCVELDAEGRPNSLRVNPMNAHVVALVQRLADQNDAQAEQLAAQAEQLATLTTRIEALEAQ